MINYHDKLKISEVSPKKAMEILGENKQSVLLDVRSKVEFDYVGHPLGAINVPWQEPPLWKETDNFLNKVREMIKNSDRELPSEELTILVLCRSGARSHDACVRLLQNGYKKAVNISEGFEGKLDNNGHRGNINGWRFHKLPWEQT